jgi:hypothetical protein
VKRASNNNRPWGILKTEKKKGLLAHPGIPVDPVVIMIKFWFLIRICGYKYVDLG